ncbi:MAG TPA: DNA adenine methylase [Allosphingosinicella sp.]|uniref:DNA adenine methylase n=1 Tax=Allosphingosinicella sp. TaxID=2823234 RepID=UPI002ED796DB
MESTSLATVKPAKPVAAYIGGKRNLSSRLVPIIDRIPHGTYAEPFVGMGGIFLKRRRRPTAEAINDISGDVVTLFRILQRHYQQFMDVLRWQITSRAEFDRLQKVDPETLTDLERAARFLYLQKLAFGGKVEGRNFGVDAKRPARFDLTKLEPMLADVHERLSGVSIERLHFAEFIRRYDHRGALFYLDPPYYDCEGDYGPDVFGREDFARLAEQLAGLAGGFILSINDRPEVREIFAAFRQIGVETTYSIATAAAGAGKRVGELVITNLPAELVQLAAND